jgi:hypothetical protein
MNLDVVSIPWLPPGDVGEMRIAAERQEPCVQFQVLTQQRRDGPSIGFDRADELVHFVQVMSDPRSARGIPGAAKVQVRGTTRLDQPSKRRPIAIRLKKRHHQGLGHRLILVADADGAEKQAVAGILHHETSDGLPEQCER